MDTLRTVTVNDDSSDLSSSLLSQQAAYTECHFHSISKQNWEKRMFTQETDLLQGPPGCSV